MVRVKILMIEIRVDQLLADHGRTFYWLAKETGISHTTLWRLKKGKALGINFETLEKMCQALKCQPGDVLALANGKKDAKINTPKPRVRKKQK
jgi:putative transcriptional regulator